MAKRLQPAEKSFVESQTTKTHSHSTESAEPQPVTEGATANPSKGNWDGLLGFLIVVGVIFGIKECNSKPKPKPIQMPQQYQPYPYQQYPPAYPPPRR